MPLLTGQRRIIPADGGTGQNPQTTAGLMALAPPGRLYSVNPFLPYVASSSWKTGQTFEYSVLVNPWDSSQLLMYYTGENAGGTGGGIGLATASVADPTHWTDHGSNPVVTPPSPTQCRQCTALYNPDAGQIWLYVSPDDLTAVDLYTSTDGINFTAHAGNPVITPTMCTKSGCTAVGNFAIMRADATHWYGYYCHRGSYGTLPSIRIATSSDGITWTDQGESGWATTAGTYYATYLEGMNQIIPMPDGNYILITSAYNGTDWVCGWASATSPLGPFTPAAAPMFTKSPNWGDFDTGMVANPSVFNLNGKWYLFYSGSITPGAGGYTNSYWQTGIAEF